MLAYSSMTPNKSLFALANLLNICKCYWANSREARRLRSFSSPRKAGCVVRLLTIVFCSAEHLSRMYTTYSHSAAIPRLDVYTLHPVASQIYSPHFVLARSALCALSPLVCRDNGLRTGALSHCSGISSGQLYFTGLSGLLKNDSRMFGTEGDPFQSSHVRNWHYLTRFDVDTHMTNNFTSFGEKKNREK